MPARPGPVRLLLTGPPGCGKTTLVQRVAAHFPGRVGGFVTREVRERGQRRGFEIVTLAGEAVLLSSVDFTSGPRVGKYGVSLENLLRVRLPALEPQPGVELMVVDEIGKMECLSERFVAAMERLWEAPVALVATVALKGSGYIEKVKLKPGITKLTITSENREALVAEVLRRLRGES